MDPGARRGIVPAGAVTAGRPSGGSRGAVRSALHLERVDAARPGRRRSSDSADAGPSDAADEPGAREGGPAAARRGCRGARGRGRGRRVPPGPASRAVRRLAGAQDDAEAVARVAPGARCARRPCAADAAGPPAAGGDRAAWAGVVVRLGVLRAAAAGAASAAARSSAPAPVALSAPPGGTSRAVSSSSARTCCARQPGAGRHDAGGGAGRPRRPPSRCRCAATSRRRRRPAPLERTASPGAAMRHLGRRAPTAGSTRPSPPEGADGHHVPVGARGSPAAPALPPVLPTRHHHQGARAGRRASMASCSTCEKPSPAERDVDDPRARGRRRSGCPAPAPRWSRGPRRRRSVTGRMRAAATPAPPTPFPVAAADDPRDVGAVAGGVHRGSRSRARTNAPRR